MLIRCYVEVSQIQGTMIPLWIVISAPVTEQVRFQVPLPMIRHL